MKGYFMILALLAVTLSLMASPSQGLAAPEAEISAEESIPVIVDINHAGREDLLQVRGIGPVLADRILAYREENGAFANIEDVMLVNGIGEAKFEQIRTMIRT